MNHRIFLVAALASLQSSLMSRASSVDPEYVAPVSAVSADGFGVIAEIILPPSDVRVSVSGSIFSGRGKPGDFGWMIEQEQYARTLFVYNDNEQQFDAFQNGDKSLGCSVGGGNAVIRPYQCRDPQRAIGIPTGSRGEGYAVLNDHVKTKIDQAISAIRALAASGKYDTVLFSQAAVDAPTLGTGMFRVSEEVKKYVLESLLRLNSN